ncbi:MAG TPA: hypothetical protein DCZ94_09315 [Lentisphaeria bacterium]|nr:MAG: hypothetical protein A2X48_18330 [Lentisphaerae bacterium GWF2_49_21]HBC87139.1 hypothetical protein [Lentisphaeria bacterium]
MKILFNFKHPSRGHKIDFRPIAAMWLIGFVLSFAAICLISYLFHDSIEPSDWNEQLKKLIPRENITLRHRSEGWGDSRFGKYGICGIDDLAKYRCPKILIWGDSYVQALQMDDKYKMAQVFTRNWKSEDGGRHELLAASIAFGGTNIADYYFMMPYYQKTAGNPICNFIFLHSFADVSADVPGISNAVFSSKPEFNLKFNYIEPVMWKQDLIQQMSNLGMDFLWFLYKDINSYELNFRLETFEQKKGHKKVEKGSKFFEIKKPNAKMVESWDFLMKKLKEVSTVPIVFVYCPDLPQVTKDETILDDSQKDSVPEFRKICKKNNIDLIDMTPDFTDFYKSTHIFPRGFQNSWPYGGHINRYGHVLTSKAIQNYMEEHIDALYPD